MRNRLQAQLEHRAVLVSRRFQRFLSFQFGLTSAAMAPHWVHAIRDNAETIGLTQKSIPVDYVMAQSRRTSQMPPIRGRQRRRPCSRARPRDWQY